MVVKLCPCMLGTWVSSLTIKRNQVVAFFNVSKVFFDRIKVFPRRNLSTEEKRTS